MPESQGSKAVQESKKTTQALDSRLAEHSFLVHMQHGGDYMDENPITGQPGQFHLSSTGRKDKPQTLALPSINTSFKSPTSVEPDKKDGKGDKTPKTPTGALSKSKRKKSRAGTTPTSS